MLKLIPSNKTEHPRFAIHVRVEDWEPCIHVAGPDKSGELVAQGAHCVRVPNVDHVHLAIRLRRGSLGQVFVRKKYRDLSVRRR
jgi:hypothetical protein